MRNPIFKNGVDCCSECGSTDIMCFDSRSGNLGRKRRKKCNQCKTAFSTIETLTNGTINQSKILKEIRNRINFVIKDSLSKIPGFIEDDAKD